ncbi:MAG: hypothetical protein ACLS29_02495 [Prevotellamassilia sp.]
MMRVSRRRSPRCLHCLPWCKVQRLFAEIAIQTGHADGFLHRASSSFPQTDVAQDGVGEEEVVTIRCRLPCG